MKYSITPKVIRSFMLNHFGNKGKVVSAGKEFNMNSPFHPDDDKEKFWMNLDTGLWQDFAAKKAGNIIQFYSWYFKVTPKVAETELLFKSLCFGDDADLNDRNQIIHTHNRDISKIFNKFKRIDFNLDMVEISDLEAKALDFLNRRQIIEFIYNTKLPFSICEDPNSLYYRRLMIPFVHNKKVIYFQGRALVPGMFPKYLNAESDLLKSSHVLYPFDTELDYVLVTEGALDAIAAQAAGLNATSTLSCHVSAVQFASLKDFGGKIILGFDNDGPGLDGAYKANKLRKKFRMAELEVCFPPKQYKDWGEAYIDGENLVEYVYANRQSLDDLFLESYKLFKVH